MYALFKDGEQRSDRYESIRGLWPIIIMWHSNAFHETHDKDTFSASLEEGYTIEEVKE